MPETSIPALADAQTQLRIGSVSTLSGVPVSTLRIWETRHAAFCPAKTTGQHRLYTQADADKAAVLRYLTEHGHSIGRIAQLDMPALQRLAQHQPGLPSQPALSALSALSGAPDVSGVSGVLAVVGTGVAQRLQAPAFMRQAWGPAWRVGPVFADLAQAVQGMGQAQAGGQAQATTPSPRLWLIRLNTLNDGVCAQWASLRANHPQAACVLLYRYGPQPVVQALRNAGCVVRREPVQDDELAELIQSTLASTTAPPRKYTEHTLQRVASLSSTMQCECPRHVAELITQLASFEQYSQDCLNKSPEDARLHARLQQMSGMARALFEQALELVAQHEGIDLEVAP